MKIYKKGFTLIELLVVIAIIGLLSTMAVVALNGARTKSRDSNRVANVDSMRLALEMYIDTCGTYPATLATATNNGCPTGTTLATFMSAIPVYPLPGPTGHTASYAYTKTGCSGAGATESCTGYTIAFPLEAPTGGLGTGLTSPNCTASPTGIACVE